MVAANWGCGGDGRNAEHDDGDNGGDDLFHDGFLSEWLGVVVVGEFMNRLREENFGFLSVVLGKRCELGRDEFFQAASFSNMDCPFDNFG